jgi:chromosome segregation ATPase
MDDRQRQRINGAAREFTDALVAAYRATSDGAATAQQLGARQVEYFFDTVMDNLRTQTEGTSQITRQLASQQELARQTTRELARVSTDNYVDFLDSVFSSYHGGTSRIRRRAEEAQRRVREAEARSEEAEKGKSEAERRTEEAKKDTEEANRRAEEAEKSARAAKRRAQKVERSAAEAQRRAEEAERRISEAERRISEAERRAEEAEKSEAESRRGERGESDAETGARRPQSKWVRTSGRSKVRGRNAGSRGRSGRKR